MSRCQATLAEVNLVQLIVALVGPEVTHVLSPERGGVIRDIRPGHQESQPSFSVFRRSDGLWRWKRHGGDEAGGSAYDLLLAFGYAPRNAWRRLEECCGRPVSSSFGRWSATPSQPVQVARPAPAMCTPLSAAERQRLPRLLAPIATGSPAHQELTRRGLADWAGLTAGQLRAHHLGSGNRLLALAGALALIIRGPDGQPWGLKVRNPGRAEVLAQQGLNRYVYRISRHGAPAWCSPGYGTHPEVLIVEGELNGAAAARALTAAGRPCDVQGLAGAGGMPHLTGLAGRLVYLYADPDAAGAAGLERLHRLAQKAGADEVRMLAPLPSGDFCDQLGALGLTTFSSLLVQLLDTAPLFSLAKAAAPPPVTPVPGPCSWLYSEGSSSESWVMTPGRWSK
jgi:hypothetical protein